MNDAGYYGGRPLLCGPTQSSQTYNSAMFHTGGGLEVNNQQLDPKKETKCLQGSGDEKNLFIKKLRMFKEAKKCGCDDCKKFLGDANKKSDQSAVSISKAELSGTKGGDEYTKVLLKTRRHQSSYYSKLQTNSNDIMIFKQVQKPITENHQQTRKASYIVY